MADWVIWFVLAGVMVILEIFTGTFYLLMIGAGLVTGGVAALLGAEETLQLIVAAAVGAAATYLLRNSKLGRSSKIHAARDRNVNLDIGEKLAIEEWDSTTGMARAMYRGALWDVELAQGAEAKPGLFIIQEVRGNRLVVSNINH